MLKPYIKSSNIIELIEESSNEDGTSAKALLRVVGPTEEWSRLMIELLRVPEEDSEFLLSIRKEYFISEENIPSFVWVLMIWGDLSDAAAEIGPVLQQKAVVTKVAPPVPPPAPPAASKIRTKKYRTDDGTRIVSSVPLPFRRGNRDNPGGTKTLGDRSRVGAYVSTVSTDGGL
jgi:hypothetical protein